MNKYLRSLSVACIVVIAATTLTKAQDATINTPPATKFTDIVEASISDYTVRNVFSYRHPNNFAIGFGVGLQPSIYELGVPLSLDLRWYFPQKNKAVTPFLNLYPGFEFIFDRGFVPDDDFFAGLNFGINIAVANNINLELALGVKVYDGNVLVFGDQRQSSNVVLFPFTVGVSF